jgi:hypothetical protein
VICTHIKTRAPRPWLCLSSFCNVGNVCGGNWQVLKIDPATEECTVLGQFAGSGWKWHGGWWRAKAERSTGFHPTPTRYVGCSFKLYFSAPPPACTTTPRVLRRRPSLAHRLRSHAELHPCDFIHSLLLYFNSELNSSPSTLLGCTLTLSLTPAPPLSFVVL